MIKHIKDMGCAFSSTLAAIREIEDSKLQPTLIRMPREHFVNLGKGKENSKFLFGIPVESHDTKFEVEYHIVIHVVAQLKAELIIDPTEPFTLEGKELKTKVRLDAFLEDFDVNSLACKVNYVMDQPVLVMTDGYCYHINSIHGTIDHERRILEYVMRYDREYITDSGFLPGLERELLRQGDEVTIMFPDLVKEWAKEALEPKYVDIKKVTRKIKPRLSILR